MMHSTDRRLSIQNQNSAHLLGLLAVFFPESTPSWLIPLSSQLSAAHDGTSYVNHS